MILGLKWYILHSIPLKIFHYVVQQKESRCWVSLPEGKLVWSLGHDVLVGPVWGKQDGGEGKKKEMCFSHRITGPWEEPDLLLS